MNDEDQPVEPIATLEEVYQAMGTILHAARLGPVSLDDLVAVVVLVSMASVCGIDPKHFLSMVLDRFPHHAQEIVSRMAKQFPEALQCLTGIPKEINHESSE